MTEPDQAPKGDIPGDDTPRGHTSDDPRRRRLLYRASHRGTYENDLMIGSFVRGQLDSFTEVEIEALEALMELPDVDLADWLTGRRAIPAEDATPMLLRIRASLVR